jgi:hypothetical protein
MSCVSSSGTKNKHGWLRLAFLAHPSWSIPPTLFLLKRQWVDFMKMVRARGLLAAV